MAELLGLFVETLGPLDHLIGQRVPLSIDGFSHLGIFQRARNDLAQLALDIGKGSTALTLVLNVLPHGFAKRGECDQGAISGATKRAIELFR